MSDNPLTNSLLRNSSRLSFRGAVSDEESRISFSFRARFLRLATLGVGMTRFRRFFNKLLSERAGRDARLIIVCGLPGSGKTTHARFLERRLRGVRFCADEWMDALSIDLWDEGKRAKIEALQWKLSERLLALGLTVIIEWGTWGRSERDTLRLGARALGAAVELHYLSAPSDILFDRIQRRGMESPPIQKDQLLHWMEKFQAPAPEEMALFDESYTLETRTVES